MKIENKKTLITGGGRGIGLAFAKAFSESGAQVILVGRNEETLQKSAELLDNASYIVADISNDDDVKKLVETVTKEHGGIDILVNNAGVSNYVPAIFSEDYREKAKQEFDINFFSTVNLINKLLPSLKESGEAAIVTVESVLAYVPSIHAVTYSASKAALHSYSRALRLQLEKDGTGIKVFEVFPPLVDTDMTAGLEVPKLSPEVVASDLLQAIADDKFSVRSGVTEGIYQAMLASPDNALLLLNKN
jgi:uncharacterized oxidoreductase